MRIIKPRIEEIKQEEGFDGGLRAMEIAARNCWKSENKIGEGTAEVMFENLKKRKHYSPMEFFTIYLQIPTRDWKICDFYIRNRFSKTYHDSKWTYITTNLRVVVENKREADLEFMVEPTDMHERRRFFRIICDRGIMAEITRHRVFSFCIESTRYANYSIDKFDNEITVIEPCWCYDKDKNKDENYQIWYNSCLNSEKEYMNLLKNGWKPEQARSVLPNSLKTDICICGFESDWKHFLDLRCAPGAHPQAREIAEMIKEAL